MVLKIFILYITMHIRLWHCYKLFKYLFTLSSFPQMLNHQIRLITGCVLTWTTLWFPYVDQYLLPLSDNIRWLWAFNFRGGVRAAHILVFNNWFVKLVFRVLVGNRHRHISLNMPLACQQFIFCSMFFMYLLFPLIV